MRFFSKGNSETEGETREIFIAILSGKDLLVRDSTGSSDPYVKVKFGKKDIHETKHVLQTLNPIYSLDTASSFILECTDDELQKNGGLLFKVKDWDRIGKNDDMGQIMIPASTILESDGEAMDFSLVPPKDKAKMDAGSITIRFRPAKPEDHDILSDAAKANSVRHKIRSLQPFSAAEAPKKTPLFATTDFTLLIEIVSCWGLEKKDLFASDPYVKVMYGTTEVHRTKTIMQTLDPIFTVKTDSIFYLDVHKGDFSKGVGLIFVVRDYDAMTKHDELGQVAISGKDLCAGTGERVPLQLMKKGKPAGYIAIRCRPGQSSDKQFLTELEASQKGRGDIHGIQNSMEIAMKTKGGESRSLLTRKSNKRVETAGPDKGKTKYRIRPEPDPDRAATTTWMTNDEIQAEAYKDSRKWLDVGTGDLGRVFIEILGADNLPNMDTGPNNETDSFVALVFEHSMAKTDVIDDCLSPRWFPWMQRAFVCRFAHPSSNILIGVFDLDMGGTHELVGRVSINLANLRANTTYVLTYDLYSRVLRSTRKAKGSVTVRVRIEHNNTRQLIFSNVTTAPVMHVNVKGDKDFKMLRQVLEGKTDLNAYSLTTLTSYLEELSDYQEIVPNLIDAAVSLLFWRGQVKILGVPLPLHSAYAFFASTTLAERPQLFPSFFCFGIAWLLLAVQIHRNNNIHPWIGARSFTEILLMLVFDRPVRAERIEPHTNEEEYLAQEAKRLERLKQSKEETEKMKEEEAAIQKEHEALMSQEVGNNTVGPVNMATSTGGTISLDPLKPVLYPIQKIVASLIKPIRITRNIVMWEEPFVAFIICAVCFVLGMVFWIVPWLFIFRWSSRLIAWGLFGPQWKFVDVFYFSKLEGETTAEKAQKERQALAARRAAAKASKDLARIKAEDAMRLRDMKAVLFGNYLAYFPVFDAERFPNTPSFASWAKPYKKPKQTTRAAVERLVGQELSIDSIIPTLKSETAKKND